MPLANSLMLHHLQEAATLARAGTARKSRKKVKVSGARNLIEKALSLGQVNHDLADEPIRTVHNLSCTGGTLFAKCIASMANVLVLNEIDLHSEMPQVTRTKAAFTPTDMISLLRQGGGAVSSDLITRIFLNDLEILREEQWCIGRKIVLRDHSHSHYLTGSEVRSEPTLRELVQSRFPILSIVTVRDPIDSYISMQKKGWHRFFSPSTFEAYCERYLAFVESYDGVPIFKYEEFTSQPKKMMRAIAKALDLDYYDEFEQVFSSFDFSGDSGRGGATIAPKPRQQIDPDFEAEMLKAPAYKRLATLLEYA